MLVADGDGSNALCVGDGKTCITSKGTIRYYKGTTSCVDWERTLYFT